MYKYLSKDDTEKIILSLNLIDDKKSDKDKLKLFYTLSNNIENNYREFKIKKKDGSLRVLAEPSITLKKVQKRLLENYLYNLKPSKYVTSYIEGKSLKDNAKPHIGKKAILKLDIEGFFDNVDFSLVYKYVFGLDKFPKSVGILLTSLVMYYGALPQGAPTSAYISNLVLTDFDSEIGAWAENLGLSYSRYSDDMTFSGDSFDVEKIIRKVRRELRKYNLELNHEKVKFIRNSRQQTVTGVVVNEKMQVSNTYRKKIRQEVYFIQKFGLDSHLSKIGVENELHYLRSLYGKILFVLNIDNSNYKFLEYKKFVRRLIDEEV